MYVIMSYRYINIVYPYTRHRLDICICLVKNTSFPNNGVYSMRHDSVAITVSVCGYASWMCSDWLRKSGFPLVWAGASSTVCKRSEGLLGCWDRKLKFFPAGSSLQSLMKSSAPSQLLRPPCALPHSLLLLLLLLLNAEERLGSRLVKGWLRLWTERDFPRLLSQSEGVPSGLEERSSRGLTSRLICLLQASSEFKLDFSRRCALSWIGPASVSSSWSASTWDPTITEGPSVPPPTGTPTVMSSEMGSAEHRWWEGFKMGGSWRVKAPVEDGGGGKSGKCALFGVTLGATKVG